MRLRVGDTVIWRGGHGTALPQLAIVVCIELCALGEKYGQDVDSVDWREISHVIVDLDNGHFAYGDQLAPVSTDPTIHAGEQ